MEQVGLVGRDIVKMLESEARRKPHIAELLERARTGTLTDDEIAEAILPLPWFRKALTEARNRSAVALAFDDPSVEMVSLEDGGNTRHGTTVIYTGPTCWLKPVRGLHAELRAGDLLFFPDEGGAWLNQTFFSGSQPELKSVEIVAHQTRKEYVEAYLAKLGYA